MTTELTWKTSLTTSGLHAAEGASRGITILDPQLNEAMATPAAQLRSAIQSTGANPGRMWRHLFGLSATTENSRQLAETAIIKTAGRIERLSALSSQLGAALAEVQGAARRVMPLMMDELALRKRPLREQWEARGPGLLRQIAILTDDQLLAPTADVVILPPVFGGAGDAHLAYNSVRIEAVLANPHADLPEIVRLAWLITQLQTDLPILSENLHADRLPHIARFALLPVTLQAAEELELVRFSPELVRHALLAWHLPVPPGIDPVQVILDWWETYQQTRPPFRVALEALDQMFG